MRDIAIIGAGVAGMTMALCLLERGHRVTLYERGSPGTGIGGGFVLWPDALAVLRRLGIAHSVLESAGRIVDMQRLDAAGAPLQRIMLGNPESRTEDAPHALLRRDLMAVLTATAVERGATVHYQRGVCDMQMSDGRVRLVFGDGSAHGHDLVVGADGRMSSVARRFVAGHNAPTYQGFINWIGVSELPAGRLQPGRIVDLWGVGHRFGYVPVSDSLCYWAAGMAWPQVPVDRPFVDHFACWPEMVREILAAAPSDGIATVYVHDLDPLPVWHRDRVVLLGDAAHASLPTAGQGASQAIEDASCLAMLLEEHAEPEEAFRRFTQERQPAAARITEQARRLAASIFSTDPADCRSRDARERAAAGAQPAGGQAGETRRQ